MSFTVLKFLYLTYTEIGTVLLDDLRAFHGDKVALVRTPALPPPLPAPLKK